MIRLFKKAIRDKNLFYQCFVKNTYFANNDSNLERFCSLQNNLTITIETAKQQFLQKLPNNYLTLILAQKHISLSCNAFQQVKRFPVFHPFFTKTDLLPFLEKRLNYLTLFFC